MRHQYQQVETEHGKFIVHRFNVLTTKTIVYQTFEQIEKPFNGTHSSISREDALGWLGQIVTRSLPKEIDDLPAGHERSGKYFLYRANLESISYQAIYTAFPHLQNVEHFSRSGEITTQEGC